MIALRKLQKVVEQRTVLDIDELLVAAGEIAAIVGPSGSGNAALLSLLTGQSRPTSGSVHMANWQPRHRARRGSANRWVYSLPRTR